MKKLPKGKRITKLKQKVDRALQDYYRARGMICYGTCGGAAQVMHHHVPKSRSNFLRYDGKNLVPLCHGCHMKHHKGDPSISYHYRKHIDEDYLMQNQYTYKKWTEDELLDLLNEYKKV